MRYLVASQDTPLTVGGLRHMLKQDCVADDTPVHLVVDAPFLSIRIEAPANLTIAVKNGALLLHAWKEPSVADMLNKTATPSPALSPEARDAIAATAAIARDLAPRKYEVVITETQRQMITKGLHNLDPAKVDHVRHHADREAGLSEANPREELNMLCGMFDDMKALHDTNPGLVHDLTS